VPRLLNAPEFMEKSCKSILSDKELKAPLQGEMTGA
jgi:hypothetical protein